MKWNTRRVAAAAIVLPAVLGVAACGKSESPAPTSGQTSAAGSTAASTAGSSASAAPSTTSDTQASGQPYQDKASFVAAMKAAGKDTTTAHVTMTMDAAGQKVSISGDTKVDASNPAMKMTMDMGQSMKIDMLLVDKKVYMKGIPNLPAGKWAVIDSSSAMGKQLMQSLGQADPTKMYDQFGAAVTDVKPVGEDTVDGDKTWKYDLTLDTKAMQAQMPADAKSAMPASIDYTVWLDQQDHLRKVTFDLSGVKADMTMSKYGEPIDVTAPKAADTVKAPM
ncbi:LppX_LprAFG lipoprotein [Terrabacter sp. NPDC080008]|uniref:LppX_LprAFG lipoprotein n=1 Tax=Terrabacter sp. NPDC080008 TaxID=3155176 RepID=UPI00344D9AB1